MLVSTQNQIILCIDLVNSFLPYLRFYKKYEEPISLNNNNIK